MEGEDAEKFLEMCRETGEFPLKKFAEMVGTIQHLDDNTTAYIADNGTVIKSKDGKELEIDTSSMTYDMLMNMFKNLPKSGNYFDSLLCSRICLKAGITLTVHIGRRISRRLCFLRNNEALHIQTGTAKLGAEAYRPQP